MSLYVKYNPEIHKGLPLYYTVSEDLKCGGAASVIHRADTQRDIEDAEKCPHWYFVKRSDVEAREAK
jgi:hypothetical protein